MVPNIILKRLYKSGSLRKTPDGVAFTLCNKIAKGEVNRVISCVINGKKISPEKMTLFPQGQEPIRGDQITDEFQLTLPLNGDVDMVLNGFALSEGKHKLVINLDVASLGNISIKVKDNMSHSPSPSLLVQHASTTKQEHTRTDIARPIKVSILGAGSAVFAKTLMIDILATPGLEKGTFALVDIDERRLQLAHAIAERLIEQSKKEWIVVSSVERTDVIQDSDFVISMIEVAGLRHVDHDYKIPLKYGVDQCIGDTIGPGGIFKMLRTGPAWMAIMKDIETLAPNALVMNYTNPMSALTLLGLKTAKNQQVGLCHSVQGTSQQLALYSEVPYEEMTWKCAGINHMAWFTELTHNEKDLYPVLLDNLKNTELYEADPVRFEIMKHFGAFVTESSGHFSEYVPYFRKRKKLIKKYMRDGYLGESGYYAKMWPDSRKEVDERIAKQLKGNYKFYLTRSEEYASHIIEAVMFDEEFVIHGNVMNHDSIPNLPSDACVEVPITVDKDGLKPQMFGELPEQLAALNRTHISVHTLMVKAVMEKDREAAVHALMLDPLTAAVCSPEEIRNMFDEMWNAQKEDLQYYL